MKILALDPATKTGWAHSCGLSGWWDLKVLRDESSGMRLIRLRNKLDLMYRDAGVDLLVFEAARHAGRMPGAVSVQSEIQGVIKTWCEDFGVDYKGYSSKTIKKHATGNGNANKDKMIKAAEHKFGKIGLSSDEADALWLLDMVQEQLL